MALSRLVSTASGTLSTRLASFERSLLVQCATGAVVATAAVAQRSGSGLVITAEDRDTSALLDAARYLKRAHGFGQPLLLDVARYAGPDRRGGREPFSPDWIRRQRELGVPVLTDSGYIDEGDVEALELILGRAQLLGDAVALLPLHPSWLCESLPRRILAAHVRDTGIPVALVIEHPDDPFAVEGVIEGLREVLSVGVEVLLLRSDAAAIGALAAGAIAAAVGSTTGLRHLYPSGADEVGAGSADTHGDRGPAAFVRPCMAFVPLPAIARAANPGGDRWRCDCGTCQGRQLRWLAQQPPQQREMLAFEHSLEALRELRDELFAPGTNRPGRLLRWREWCDAAVHCRLDLRWPPESAPHRWHDALRQTKPARVRLG